MNFLDNSNYVKVTNRTRSRITESGRHVLMHTQVNKLGRELKRALHILQNALIWDFARIFSLNTSRLQKRPDI